MPDQEEETDVGHVRDVATGWLLPRRVISRRSKVNRCFSRFLENEREDRKQLTSAINLCTAQKEKKEKENER